MDLRTISRSGVKSFFLEMRFYTLPLVLTMALCGLIVIPSQSIEIFQIYGDLVRAELSASERGRAPPGSPDFALHRQQIFFAFLFLSLTSLSIIACCHAARRSWVSHLQDAANATIRDIQIVRRWIPIILAAAPWMALLGGLSLASSVDGGAEIASRVAELKKADPDSQKAIYLQRLLDGRVATAEILSSWAFAQTVALGLVVASVTLVRATGFGAKFALRWPTITFPPFWFSIVTVLATISLLFVMSGGLSRSIGVAGLVFLFFSLLFSWVSAFYYWTSLTGVPFFNFVVLWAALISLFSWADNHHLSRIEDIRPEKIPVGATLSKIESCLKFEKTIDSELERNFLKWYCSRQDLEAFKKSRKIYPVYIVAAQGGGIYSAAHTYYFLSAMATSCQRFAHHLFAISSVSGGSVGAAFYGAYSRRLNARESVVCKPIEEQENKKSKDVSQSEVKFNIQRRQVLQKDYLSPLVGRAITLDFVQRLWPRPYPSFSRAKALEESIAIELDLIAASKGGNSVPYSQAGVLGEWSPYDAQPALIFNTTETGSGRRRVIAPFKFAQTPGNDLRFVPLSRDRDVPIVGAASASARFPWVLPPAWFQSAGGKVRVVDGGYFENSGVATGLDLIRDLDAIIKKHGLQAETFLISLISPGYQEQSFFGLSETLAPIRALINTRTARTQSLLDVAEQGLGAAKRLTFNEEKNELEIEDAPYSRLIRAELGGELGALPLGWWLSQSSRFQIRQSVGTLRHCKNRPDFRSGATSPGDPTSADCAKRLIYLQISGDL